MTATSAKGQGIEYADTASEAYRAALRVIEKEFYLANPGPGRPSPNDQAYFSSNAGR